MSTDLVSNQSAEGLLEDCDLFGPARDDVLAMAVKMANVLDEPGQDLEADFPKSKGNSGLGPLGLRGGAPASPEEGGGTEREIQEPWLAAPHPRKSSWHCF